MQLLKIIFVVFEVVVLFNLLIFVHELGHFLAARWRGLKVDRFAIWFGKPIWKKTIGGVEYALGSIPAGGYVSLPQMAPMELIEGKTDAPAEPLPHISALDKIIVAVAGPLFSFGLAVAFACVVSVVGRPVSEAEGTTTIGYVLKDGPAFKAGLQPGDVFQTIDGQPVTKFSGIGSSVMWRIVSSEGATIPITIKRGDQTLSFDIAPMHEETKPWQRKSLRKIEIGPAQVARPATFFSNSPAVAAGLKAGDDILAVNGQKLYSPEQLDDYINDHGTNLAELTIRRDGKQLAISVVPEKPLNSPTNLPSLGIYEWDSNSHLAYPNPISEITASVGAMFDTFNALFSHKSDIRPQHLGGAVKILSIYYMLFQDEDGWRQAIWFSVIMNVNLALLNMLPFPVLDGGHIMLALIESIRRRPVSAKILNYLQSACAMALIGYMLYIAFYDVQDLVPSGKGGDSGELKFAPKSQPTEYHP
jgi:regulator of sigma E protease